MSLQESCVSCRTRWFGLLAGTRLLIAKCMQLTAAHRRLVHPSLVVQQSLVSSSPLPAVERQKQMSYKLQH